MNDPQQYRILLVDDDVALGRLLRKCLERAGYLVQQAPSIATGLTTYREGRFDAIVLDHSLPDGTGLDLFRMLSADGPVSPAIMLTSTGDEYLAVEAMKSGLSDYLVKDAQGAYLQELPAAIERAKQLRQRQIEDGLRQHHDRLEELVGHRTAELAGVNAELEFANRQLESEISERWQVEKALRKSQSMLSLQNQIADVFLTDPDEGMYEKVLAIVLEALACELGVFAYIDENGALVAPSLSHKAWDNCQLADKSLRFPRETWKDNAWSRAILDKCAVCSNQPGRVPLGHVAIQRVLAAPILYQDDVIGLFMAANKATDFDAADQTMLENVARFVAHALYTRLERERQQNRRREAEEALAKQTLQLSERVKELNCLRTITEIIQDSTGPESEFLQAVVDVVPGGWRHPDMACARIVFDGRVFCTQNFRETQRKSSAPILIKGRLCGGLEVCYLEERPSEDGYPFSSEERLLIDDITERVGRVLERTRAENENNSLRRQIEFILGATKTGLSIVNADRQLVYVDPKRRDRFGDFAGKTCPEYFGRHAILEATMERALQTQKPVVTETVLPWDDNRPIQMTAMPYQDDRGRWLLAQMSVDLSDRKLLERELTQAQRLEAIGHLAAGIAHEINTPTQYVADNLHFLRDSVRDLRPAIDACIHLLEVAAQGPLPAEAVQQAQDTLRAADVEYLLVEMPRAVEQSIEGTVRVAGIVRAMKEFSHPGREERQFVDLNRAIESTVTISRNEWKYVAALVTDFDPSMPQVLCLPNEINQAVLNLVVNAAHAVGRAIGDGTRDHGTITVRTRYLGDWAQIQVEDTGTGIPEELRTKIFDPFFTTKGVGEGTGQGLSIVHAVVVKKHGGTIHVDSEVGRGSVFTLRLPIEDREQPAASERAMQDTLRRVP